MAKIIDVTGKGAAISGAENDSNLSTLAGINVTDATNSRTVDIDDQGATIEFTFAGAVAVTLDDIATIAAALHTNNFTVTLIATGASTVATITPDGTDSINTGVSTIELTTDEYVKIQTDGTGAIWNIINTNHDVVTETGTQTLTNKTLTSPTITGAVLDVATFGGGTHLQETTASASGATVSFTSAPSWATQVIITLSKVSASAAATIQLQLGETGGLDSTGDYNTTYMGFSVAVATGATSATATVFNLGLTGGAGQSVSGVIILSKQQGANEWCLTGSQGGTPSIYTYYLSGSKTVSGALTQMQFSLSTGTYDAGNIGVEYKG